MTEMQADFQIRPATPADITSADWPAIITILNAVFPDHPQTLGSLNSFLDRLRQSDLNPHCTYWLAETAGEVVAVAQVWQAPWMYHPDRYHAELAVRPDHQRRGIGTRLAATMQEHLQGRGAAEVLAGAYETAPHALRMLEERGFREAMRFFDNMLQLDGLNLADWHAEMQMPEGVRALSLADLMAEVGEEAAMSAYHACFLEARQDVPRTAKPTPLPLPEFSQRQTDTNFFAPGILLAVTAAGEVVALSELWKSPGDPQRLNVGLTGTRRAWRRRGLGLALKLRGLKLAQELGVRELWTHNASTNLPMLALNERLGFRPRPAYVECQWGQV